MKQLIREMKPQRRDMILAPLFKMLEAGLNLRVPLLMKQMMDEAIPAAMAGEGNGLIWFVGLEIFLDALFGFLLAVAAQYFAARAATGYSARLRELLFGRIQKLRFEELDNAGTSMLVTRMTSDCDQVQNGLNLALRLLLRSPFIVFGAMILAFTIDPKAALIFAVLIPVLLVITFAVMLRMAPLYRKVQSRLDRVTQETRENLSGVRVIRAFGNERGEIREFIENHENLKGFQLAVGRVSAILNPLTTLLLNACVVLLIYVGAIRVNIGILTQGAVVALVNYMLQILVELIKLANLVIQITRAYASLKRISEVTSMKEAESTEDPENKTPLGLHDAPSVRFDHVSLAYQGASEAAIRDLTFDVKSGEKIAVIGGTGSGKTSLVSLIPGYYRATEGEILLDGRPISAYDEKALRRSVTTVFQKAVLFSGTVRENLCFGLSEEEEQQVTDEDLYDALKTADAYDLVMARGGLDAECEQGGRNFSGGQRQRLTIARALVRKPRLLVLDDSSSALDFATDAKIRAGLAALSWDMTVFTVTQRAATAMHQDRILVLDEGRLVGSGTHDELLENCPVYREIVESQT